MLIPNRRRSNVISTSPTVLPDESGVIPKKGYLYLVFGNIVLKSIRNIVRLISPRYCLIICRRGPLSRPSSASVALSDTYTPERFPSTSLLPLLHYSTLLHYTTVHFTTAKVSRSSLDVLPILGFRDAKI